MGRGSTALDSHAYDSWLASQHKEKDLRQRKIERAKALKRDGSGYMFNIDSKPVKVDGFSHMRKELDKRGLAIEGEYTRRKK